MQSRATPLVVRRLLLFQAAGCLFVTLIGLFWGPVTAYSALLGGLVCLLPNCYFAYRAFKFQGARAARHIIRSFYAGEAGKLMLTAVLFGLVFSQVSSINALAVFLGFGAIQFIQWLVPIVQSSVTKPVTKAAATTATNDTSGN